MSNMTASYGPIYVFDLDGTLANAEHRMHYIRGVNKDWDAFFKACPNDKPMDHIGGILLALEYDGASCQIWTGRSEIVRAETEQWLDDQFGWGGTLLMRGAKDRRPDHVLKEEWLIVGGYKVITAFEDRSRVVQMWRDNGVPCLQVAPGDF